MEDFLPQNFDVAALLVVIPVVCVLVALGIASLRSRWLNRRRLMKGIRTRPDVIRRDLCRMAEYFGRLPEADAALWRPFEYGLAAMAACQWGQAIEHFRKAQANASGAQLVPIYNQTGVCHYTQGRPDDALRDFVESARLAKQYGDAPGKAPALANIGVLRRDRGELGSALKQLREALAVARKSGDQRAAAACLGCIGNIYLDRGVLDKALKFHEEALAISREIGDNCGVASGLRNLGSIYRDKAEFHEALQQYEEAHAVSREVGDRMCMASCLGSIGSTHRYMGELDQALKFHESALALEREVGYKLGVATELGNIGLILTDQRQYGQAVLKLAESLTIFLAVGVANGPRHVLFGLSRCDDWLGRDRMQESLERSGLVDGGTADLLDRIDQVRLRRPRQRSTRRAPFVLRRLTAGAR